MSLRLEGRAAWISGGASGIGEATVRLFASEGARVAIVDVQAEAGRRLEAAVRVAGGEAMFIECDVADEEQVRKSIEQADVHAFEPEHGDQPERLLMRQERESEIGAGQFQFHERSSGKVTFAVSHSAAVR